MTGLAAPSALLLSLSLCLSIAAMVWPHRVFAHESRATSRSHVPSAKHRSHPHKPARPTRTHAARRHAGAAIGTASKAKPVVKSAAKATVTSGRPSHRPHTRRHPKAAAAPHRSRSHARKARTARTARTAHPRHAARVTRRHAAAVPKAALAPRVSKSAAAAAALLGATAEARGPVKTTIDPSISAPTTAAATQATPLFGATSLPMLLSRCGYTPRARNALHTRSIYVRDVLTGTVLLAKDATRVRPIASLSKMMTAVVARDAERPLSTKLTVTNADTDDIKHTHSRLTVGSTLSRGDMFHIALMSSENRAAAALSRDYPGGRPAFMRAMNAKARALGMQQTHFDNPTGLSPHNVSTAESLAKLVDYAVEDPLLRRFSTDKWDIVHPGHGELVYVNSNRLVRLSHWPVALQKTGFINESGHSMMMRLDIHGRPITMVLLGSPTPQGDISDAIKIRHWLTCSLK